MSTLQREYSLIALPPNAAIALLEAKTRVAARLEHATLDKVTADVRSKASRLAERARDAGFDLQLVNELAQANAEVAAALSTSVDFPRVAAIPALIYVANSLSNLHDLAAWQGHHELALDLAVHALGLVRVFKAFTGLSNLEGITYSLASKAAESAGFAAAARRLTIDELWRSFEVSITAPYAGLMPESDLSGPRAFAVAFLLRGAAAYPTDAAAKEYLASVVTGVKELIDQIAPRSPGANQAFRLMVAQDLERAEIWLSPTPTRGFQWQTT